MDTRSCDATYSILHVAGQLLIGIMYVTQITMLERAQRFRCKLNPTRPRMASWQRLGTPPMGNYVTYFTNQFLMLNYYYYFYILIFKCTLYMLIGPFFWKLNLNCLNFYNYNYLWSLNHSKIWVVISINFRLWDS